MRFCERPTTQDRSHTHSSSTSRNVAATANRVGSDNAHALRAAVSAPDPSTSFARTCSAVTRSRQSRSQRSSVIATNVNMLERGACHDLGPGHGRVRPRQRRPATAARQPRQREWRPATGVRALSISADRKRALPADLQPRRICPRRQGWFAPGWRRRRRGRSGQEAIGRLDIQVERRRPLASGLGGFGRRRLPPRSRSRRAEACLEPRHPSGKSEFQTENHKEGDDHGEREENPGEPEPPLRFQRILPRGLALLGVRRILSGRRVLSHPQPSIVGRGSPR